MPQPDFFLSARLEYHSDLWDGTRACSLVKRLQGPRAAGYWLVAVQPPIPQLAGAEPDSDLIILAERREDDDLANLTDGIVPVYVCAIRNRAAVNSERITESDILHVANGEVARRPELLSA